MKVSKEYITESGAELKEIKLSVFRKFFRKEDLDDLGNILKENGVLFQSWKKADTLVPIILGERLSPMFWIEIRESDFPKVNELLEKSVKENIQEGDIENHYLNEMSDIELKEIISKSHEWNPESVLIAKMIMEKRA